MANDYEYAANRALGKVGNNAIKAANEKMTNNAGHGVKYAYIPQSPAICGFCCMMAGRGFDFTAGSKDKLHDSCTCKKIPKTDKAGIDGYDSSVYKKRYEMCRKTISDLLTQERYVASGSPKSFSEWVTDEIVDEMNGRSRLWLGGSEEIPVKSKPKKLLAIIAAERPHEIECAKRLSGVGIETTFVPDFEKYRDPFTGLIKKRGLADLVNGVEIKCLNGASTKNTLKTHLSVTSRKRDAKSVIFDNSQNGNMSDDEIVLLLRNKLRSNFKRGKVYVLTHDNELVRAR